MWKDDQNNKTYSWAKYAEQFVVKPKDFKEYVKVWKEELSHSTDVEDLKTLVFEGVLLPKKFMEVSDHHTGSGMTKEQLKKFGQVMTGIESEIVPADWPKAETLPNPRSAWGKMIKKKLDGLHGKV